MINFNSINFENKFNIRSLFIDAHDDNYNRTTDRKAYEATARLVHSSAILQYGEYMGLQIDTRNFTNSVFASTDDITSDDYDWIFSRYAQVTQNTFEFISDLYESNRKVYALIPSKKSERISPAEPENGEKYENSESAPTYEETIDMIEMIKREEAIIRIIFTPSPQKSSCKGAFLISLPKEMPLRMYSMLSMAFPNTAVEEIDKLSTFEEKKCLSEAMAFDCTRLILFALMYSPNAPRSEKTEDDHFVDDGDDDYLEEHTTPLDELMLSVRSYNCLRRAGITTVEELQKLSDGELENIRNLSAKCVEEIKTVLGRSTSKKEPEPKKPVDYQKMLDELIGLQSVKEQIKKVSAFARMKRDLVQSNENKLDATLNMSFIGNPGTAKTTVARIIAGILYDIGLLSNKEPLEVGRADLVSKYVGNTAIQIKEVFNRAKGKLLFIDEAYSLVDDRKNSFGDEAIDAIVQEMENSRNDTIVIFAGYPEPMKRFFERNPGLRSRVPFTINFCDYSPDEMVQISELIANKKGFKISPEAIDKIRMICSCAINDPLVGNGRFCRNLVENAIISYALRVYGDENTMSIKNQTLIADDFTTPVFEKEIKKTPIGFCA